MAIQPYRLESPRILATVPLAANTVTSLRTLISNFVQTTAVARALFTEDVADEATKLLLTGKEEGYTVYQISTGVFFELRDAANPDNAASWIPVTAAQMNLVVNFLKTLSGLITVDSSLSNGGAATTYVMNAWVPTVTPTSSAMTTYGIQLTGTERTCSGYSDQYYLYSLAGTSIKLDIIFATGVS